MTTRRADLYPPLGVKGGPCKVVQRILQRVEDARVQEKLVTDVEHNRELTNAQTAMVYAPERERGPHPFNPMVLVPHAQYRMDLRGITVKDIQDSMGGFRKWFMDPKNRKELQELNEDLQSGRQVAKRFTDQQRTLVVGLDQDPVAIVTTYPTTGGHPQAPPGGCTTKVAGYRAPAGELSGYSTYRSEKPTKGIDEALGDTVEHLPGESPKSDRERAKPQRTDTKENLERHTPGNNVYNVPSGSSKDEGRKIHVRTPGEPGEDYGHPYKENVYPRRTDDASPGSRSAGDVEAGMLFPSYSDKQRKQKGRAKLYYQKYYHTHQGKIRARAKRDYLHKHHNPMFKLEKKRRNSEKYGWRFNRLPSGGYHTNADRARDTREKKAGIQIPFYHPNYGRGLILDVRDQEVFLQQTDPMGGDPLGEGTVPLFTFLRGAEFDSEGDIDTFFDLADADSDRVDAPDEAMDAEGERLATFYRETFRPGDNLDPGDGAQDLGAVSPLSANPALKHYDFDRDDRKPAESMNNISPTDNNPGSAKVIPEGHDFANRMAIRVAMKMSEIIQGIDPGIRTRARGIIPKMKRSDGKNVLYHFTIPGSRGEKYLVKVKGVPSKGTRTLSKMDLKLSCSCNFWQFQGPEHWAKAGDYLLGKPRGQATRPGVKDPKGRNRVCKHVIAVLEQISKWPAFEKR